MQVFEERGTGVPRGKPLRAEMRTNKLKPTYDAQSGNLTQATLVGGECSHHYATTALRALLFCGGRSICMCVVIFIFGHDLE